ncbi:MAG: dTDP-4-dehydrorhamnose 3,5-epimerase family protein [Prevotella sp.]|nr:dTDP-4-dehydrorhamnose 3,5-epimerase family protein [Prevotella sp.]
MNVIETAIDGVFIIEPRIFKDARGYFFESYSQREFDEKVTIQLTTRFVQDNESKSTYGVIRGLHFQRPPYSQSKLVRCVQGAVLDVVVDIRKGSPTYGQHVVCLLCGHDEEGIRIAEKYKESVALPKQGGLEGLLGLQFFIPKGMAHGFAVLSDTAVFQYKCDEFYHPEAEGGISIFSKSSLAGSLPSTREQEGATIDWHVPTDHAILSEKDTKHPLLSDFDSPFTY